MYTPNARDPLFREPGRQEHAGAGGLPYFGLSAIRPPLPYGKELVRCYVATMEESERHAHMRATLEFINDCIEHFGQQDSVVTSETNRGMLLALYGPITQIHRFAQSSAILSNAGFFTESHVIARSALEYAATVQYAYLRKDGLARFKKSVQSEQANLFKQLAQWQKSPEYRDMAESVEIPQTPRMLPKTSQILDVLDPGKLILQSTYAVLSQTTHVRGSSLARYFERNGDSLNLVPGKQSDGFANVSAAALAIAVMSAGWVLAHITEDADRLEVLDRYSEALRLPVRYDDQWLEEDRAHLD